MRRPAQVSTTIAPAMSVASPPTWAQAIWIGELDDRRLPTGEVRLQGGEGFSTARLLVRHGHAPRGFVHLPICAGAVDGEQLRSAISRLPVGTVAVMRETSPPISVIICTRDRPGHLRGALQSALALEYPDYELIVVDNNPASGLTRDAAESIADRRIRVVDAPIQGLARARNIGLATAMHPIVAFTDDDVVVDRWWLHGIADGFAAGPKVACVCGMVPTGELASVSQAYFDRRVQWARSCRPEVFALSESRPDEPLFPFQVGRFGTGANFAVLRDVALGLHGFDEALGIGSPTGGGEDIDMFVRILLAGYLLAYEPAALVWHRHRADLAGLSRQIRDYGSGLGAWLTKLAMSPPTARMMLRRASPGLRHIWRITRVEGPDEGWPINFPALGKLERKAILSGPPKLLRARLSGARSRPLQALAANRRQAPPVEHVEPRVAL